MFKDAKNIVEHNVSEPDSLIASHAREKTGMKWWWELPSDAQTFCNLWRYWEVCGSIQLMPVLALPALIILDKLNNFITSRPDIPTTLCPVHTSCECDTNVDVTSSQQIICSSSTLINSLANIAVNGGLWRQIHVNFASHEVWTGLESVIFNLNVIK